MAPVVYHSRMPAQIYRNHAMARGKMLGLWSEERAIARPPVHEYKGGLASAVILKSQLYAVSYNRRHKVSSSRKGRETHVLV
jgi:hypothetical protein